ncbi:MAG TPA: oligopeptide/dipeptide ABC transporter ATP-binding protein, partial [Cryptosporangiaceae bacterium]|nr:oligopeptide/dipeptide ABC transporter ATP-binding protein [Cryptosporangiaceae bacterium]
VMYLGRIIEAGPVEKILRAPEHPYTQALISVLPESTGVEPVVLAGEPPDPTRIPSGCRFHPRCQVLASGEPDRIGVGNRCRGEDLAVLAGGPAEQVACHYAHAVSARAGREG